MYEIIKDGEIYRCTVRIQDGVERWNENGQQRAIASVIKAAKFYNHIVITGNDIRQLTYPPKQETMTKNLYHIQDDDRPMYVVGTSWQDALEAWQRHIGAENNHPPEEADPTGITLIAKDNELIS